MKYFHEKIWGSKKFSGIFREWRSESFLEKYGGAKYFLRKIWVREIWGNMGVMRARFFWGKNMDVRIFFCFFENSSDRDEGGRGACYAPESLTLPSNQVKPNFFEKSERFCVTSFPVFQKSSFLAMVD